MPRGRTIHVIDSEHVSLWDGAVKRWCVVETEVHGGHTRHVPSRDVTVKTMVIQGTLRPRP